MYKLKVRIVKSFAKWLGLHIIVAVNEEDRRQILEAVKFQPNDVY